MTAPLHTQPCGVYIPGGTPGRNPSDNRCHHCGHPRRNHAAEIVETYGPGLILTTQITRGKKT